MCSMSINVQLVHDKSSLQMLSPHEVSELSRYFMGWDLPLTTAQHHELSAHPLEHNWERIKAIENCSFPSTLLPGSFPQSLRRPCTRQSR